MGKRILILTNRADIHADAVVRQATAQGAIPFRINLDEFPRDFALDIELAPGRTRSRVCHVPSGDTLCVADVGAVWMRKAADHAFARADLSPQERVYAAKETEHVLFGLLYSLECYWMSHPRAVRGALWKGEQLLRAARMGFRIPASLISNRPDSVRRFSAAVGGDMVFKSLSSPYLGADQVAEEDRIASGLPTTRIAGEHESMIESVAQLPCLFQEYVAKSYELRVTVIGDQVFAAKIHSQDDERTMTDYRDYSAEIRYEATQLPDDVTRRCREFVHSYGLTFGALDLIVTPQGEYVFLENNPGGQFLFVEQLAPELQMIDALTQCLIEGARRAG